MLASTQNYEKMETTPLFVRNGFFGSERSPRSPDVVCPSVCPSVRPHYALKLLKIPRVFQESPKSC